MHGAVASAADAGRRALADSTRAGASQCPPRTAVVTLHCVSLHDAVRAVLG